MEEQGSTYRHERQWQNISAVNKFARLEIWSDLYNRGASTW